MLDSFTHFTVVHPVASILRLFLHTVSALALDIGSAKHRLFKQVCMQNIHRLWRQVERGQVMHVLRRAVVGPYVSVAERTLDIHSFMNDAQGRRL